MPEIRGEVDEKGREESGDGESGGARRAGCACREVPLASYPTLHNPPNPLSNGRPVLRFGLVARRGTQNKGPVI